MVSEWLRQAGPRRALFAGVVLLLFSALGWLGWRLLAQDQQLASQRLADDREVAADVIVAAFEQRLSALERDLDAAVTRRELTRAVPVSAGVVLVRIGDGSIRTWPENRLRYYPELPARSQSAAAHAIVRLAQNNLKAHRPAAALDAYTRLGAFGAVPIGDVVGGIPAALFAHLGRMTVYEREGDNAGRSSAARALEEALQSARWPVSAPTYQFLDEQVRRVLPSTPGGDSQLVLAEAASWLWEQRAADVGFPPSGRASRVFASGPALLVWRGSSGDTVALIANRDYLDSVWMAALKPIIDPRRARVALTTAEGQPILGAVSAQDRPVVRSASATTLPWTIQVTNAAGHAALQERQQWLLAGMAVLFVLIVAGAWVIERTVAREVAVADLQSEFVSAVSHEFRTPLTTLCQLSELLMRDRVASDSDRRQYYELLHGESQRLRRLVETLLNFGRLEAGRMEFRFDTVDVGALVRQTVDEFGGSQQARQHQVQIDIDDAPNTLRADREVLRTVVWNLLENAAKYSPDCDTIWVTLRRRDGDLALAVRDRGVGIPRAEQRQVFDKFVRGAGARASDVGGTGVGLAMARRIVEAHGGDITLDSAPGTGSTFTVVLPLVNSQLPTRNSQTVVAAG